jgi:hypothetical protein
MTEVFDKFSIRNFAKFVTPITVAIYSDGDKFDPEAKASAPTSSLVDNRPANEGPSLCQCWGRWTQKAEPATKSKCESGSVEKKERF